MTTDTALAQMITQQVRTGDVHDERTLETLARVPRELFVPAQWRALDYAETALPLGHGKHMLTTLLVGRILQALRVRPGEQALEVGTGSGYLSACLATLGASVQSLEIHADLAAQARANLKAAGCEAVEVTCGDGMGLTTETAYDLIVLTGSLPIYQPCFERALKYGGRLFVVVGGGPVMSARLVTRTGQAEFKANTLFETGLEPLENAPALPTFRF
jgi:protein-L-isoaspartate(D-aspartate) O-methyltransferase